MRSSITQGIVFVLPLLLLGAIFYPAALATPYQADVPKFAIAHESTEEFNDRITDRNAAIENAVSVEDLSKNQRKAFETAKEQEPYSDGMRLFKPPVCKDLLLICDEYTEYPETPDNGVIEDTDGELYSVWDITGNVRYTDFDSFLQRLSKGFALGPFAFFLAYYGWRDTTSKPTRTAVSYGLILLTFVLAYPYILMLLDVELAVDTSTLVVLPLVTWIVILVEIWRSHDKTMEDTQAKTAR